MANASISPWCSLIFVNLWLSASQLKYKEFNNNVESAANKPASLSSYVGKKLWIKGTIPTSPSSLPGPSWQEEKVPSSSPRSFLNPNFFHFQFYWIEPQIFRILFKIFSFLCTNKGKYSTVTAPPLFWEFCWKTGRLVGIFQLICSGTQRRSRRGWAVGWHLRKFPGVARAKHLVFLRTNGH